MIGGLRVLGELRFLGEYGVLGVLWVLEFLEVLDVLGVVGVLGELEELIVMGDPGVVVGCGCKFPSSGPGDSWGCG